MVPIRVTRGRSKFANKQQLVSIRYSPEVVGYFKASGAGWQARIDAVLKEYVRTQPIDDAQGAQPAPEWTDCLQLSAALQ
ncbi:MAG: BrnA antitoxin family protein [Cyanobacteriota bacterium]